MNETQAQQLLHSLGLLIQVQACIGRILAMTACDDAHRANDPAYMQTIQAFGTEISNLAHIEAQIQ